MTTATPLVLVSPLFQCRYYHWIQQQHGRRSFVNSFQRQQQQLSYRSSRFGRWCMSTTSASQQEQPSSSSSSSSVTITTTTTDTTKEAVWNRTNHPTESNTTPPTFRLSQRLFGLDAPTVWQEFSPLAVQYQAINLGQGFPDWEPPDFVIDSMMTSISPPLPSSTSSASISPLATVGRGANQYARSYAHMPLAIALADIYTHRWRDVLPPENGPIDPHTQVATATGCTNVLFCALQGLLNPGDEVILLEPAFDIYSSQVKMAGGIPIYVPLRPNMDMMVIGTDAEQSDTVSASDVFTLDMDELQAAITDRTKVILINTPHNPTGKMFTQLELQSIATMVQNYPSITIISDEVYEHIIFDPDREPHISIATILPQQTLTLSSAGKTFSATGWKVGWAIGPAHLIKAVTAVQQWVNFSAATPNQDAIAMSLLRAEQTYTDPANPSLSYTTYYEYLAAEYKRKRTLLIDALRSAGMIPVVPPGGFFIMVDTSAIQFPYQEKYAQLTTDAMPTTPMPRDWALSRWLTEEVGVTAIPPSAFYSVPNVHLARNMLRFAFCKSDATIQEAHVRLEQYFATSRPSIQSKNNSN
jgi:kynurenine---oxoglutarate transaminase / cysteine-S-conjugate beta-lyase / glutamine---phenylpyruvate transaminase